MLELLRRIRFFFHRDALERDLAEEMQHHLALKTEESGPAAAARQFGNVTALQEETRAMWTSNILEQIGQDIRYAFRTMAASPLFTIAATLSLALGIGANTAIYSFMDAILMRALSVQRPEELVILHWRAPARVPVVHSVMGTMYGDKKTGRNSPNFPYAAWGALASNNDALQSLFAYTTHGHFNLVVNGQAETAGGLFVSGNFYSGIGVVPAAGRLIGANDDQAGAAPVAVLGYDYWKRRFASNPSVVGQTILVNNVPVVIAGVSAPGFFGVDASERADISLPLRIRTTFSDRPGEERRLFFDRNFYWVEMMGRLRPGVDIAQAQTAIAARFNQFALSTVTSDKEKEAMPQLWLESGSSGLDSLRRQYSKPLYVLMAMVGLILTIACANVANLLLARSSARSREMAVRLSLGAGRWRIVRQLLTESVMLSLTGGALGLLVAFWGIRFITWVIANGKDDFTLHAELNWPVLGFTLALALVAGIVFGLAPALQSTKGDLTPALKEGKTGQARSNRRFPFQPSLGQALVAAQIAMSLILVIGAGLFVKTIANLHSIDLGFNRENVLVFAINARQGGYKDDGLPRFYDEIAQRIRQLPGARSVGMSNFPLVSRYVDTEHVAVPGAPPVAGRPDEGWMLHVDAGFLDAMQIPLMIGRGLDAHDMASPNVAIVNQKFASTFFDGADPVGHHFLLGDPKKPLDVEIVGVARGAHYNSIQEEIPPTAYLPFTQDLPGLRQMFFEVRTSGDPLALMNPIRGIIHAASAAVSITDVGTQKLRIEQTVGQERTFADLCTCFAALALAIACVGLYGAMAYAVARRTRELGIRMALGAKRAAIVWMVLREALALSAIGLLIGYLAARQTSEWIASFLFGLKPTDPVAIALSVFILLAASVAASLAPAWKASHTDPMLAIRHE